MSEEVNLTHMMPAETINSDQQVFNRIMDTPNSKAQLEKVSKEFEAIFITKMLTLMDKTVDREGGILGEETSYYDKMKSYMFDELGRELANNPRTTFGFAKQIYEQMEKYVN
jgi:Rod binding domain-containing protein